MINISLNTANLNRMIISSPEFRVWQHLEDHWNKTQPHKLADMPTVPVAPLYKHIINNNRHIIPFALSDESVDDIASIWTLFSHTGIYIMVIGLLIPTGLGIFCSYFFWCQPARLACQPLWSGSMWHTIVNDNCRGSTHLQMQWQGWTGCHKTLWESWSACEMETYTDSESTEATSTVKSSSKTGSLDKTQNPGNAVSTYGLLYDLGMGQLQHSLRSLQI